ARLSAALAASALVHWTLLSSALLDAQWKAGALHTGNAPMTVRLAAAPVPVSDVPATPEAGARRMPLPAMASPGGVEGTPENWGQNWGQARFSGPEFGPLPRKFEPGPNFPQGTRAPVLPQASDPDYYAARDLDDYPRPLAPLPIDRPARDGAGEVRLEILIDERGVVRDVVFASPAGPGGADEALRAALATTLFLPARKDGRPVRSRIVLSLTPGAPQREP
ncbi:MAG: energy transducer TonB, partial [Burkholderiales bacterium]